MKRKGCFSVKYLVSKHIDYIALSVSDFMIADDAFGKWEDTHPRQRNYNRAKIFDIGMIVQWHSERPDMKISIILSGETLAKMRDMGFTDYDILHWLKSMPNAKFSRIDICVTSMREDGKMHGFLPHAINYLATNDMCDTKLKVDNPVADSELYVQTAYIGSRKSRNRIFRAYDKGIELGEDANKIIRYELETRKNATHIADEIHDKRTDIAAMIRRYVDFPAMEEWLEIMGTDVASNWKVDEYRSESEINNARWEWIFRSVAPAIAKALYADGVEMSENKNADKLSSLIAYHYNALVDKNG